MNLQNSIIVATRALQRNKMRTMLTCLGIIIGVMSVILMVGIGNSARIAVREKIASFGTNAISIFSYKKPFVEADLKSIKSAIAEIQYITPMNFWEFPVRYRNRTSKSLVYGVSNDYYRMNNWELESGSYFSREQMLTYDKVAIIGYNTKKTLYGGENPVGNTLLINNIPFRVIGYLQEKGLTVTGKDIDSGIQVPYTTLALKLVGVRSIANLYVATYDENQVEMVKKNLLEYLRKKNNLTQEQMDDYRLATSKELMQMADQITTLLTILLGAIACVSLIVGGIGIMNIMLASVSERTREIGIRMAIGAKNRDILLQFLTEAVFLSSFGGVVGIITGLIIYFLYTYFAKQPFIFSFVSVISSFLFAGAVGVGFGYYPAKKASRLNPIDALRFE